MNPKTLELLSPAANYDTAVQAILHGADAVYIGPPSHGARKSASNSIEDIEKAVDFAHRYRAKVYATVNTIIYDNEIKKVEELCKDLYHAGVDALIVQDMGILRMKIPPIALHASTQCDIRTPEKALFLQEVGFSQLVLARELTLKEIKDITETVSIPVETFIHGALCVSYSGRCHSSFALTGRSANRGECAQICRLPYTLKDTDGKIIAKDRYLLSLKDFNATQDLNDLIGAGVSSFKIEGRLKDIGYVKNLTAHYNLRLNEIIKANEGKYRRSSVGSVELNFDPKPDKSFNRGFTNYFLKERKPLKIASLLTPKSQGELITDVRRLNNGDGISFYDKSENFTGVNVNKIDGEKIIPGRKVIIPENATIYRTYDVKWEKIINGETAVRKIKIDVNIEPSWVGIRDERGIEVKLPLNLKKEPANREMDYKNVFEKLGNTPYVLNSYKSSLPPFIFFRISELTSLRRNLLFLLDRANKITYPFQYFKGENLKAKYPSATIDYRDNVSNRFAEQFYRQHGVTNIEKGAEISKKMEKGQVVMTSRHCILRELGMCKKEKRNREKFRAPLYLEYNGGRFRLDFDCNQCEMKVCL